MVQGQGHPFTIGELARAAGVKTSALRYYERRGILPQPRRLPSGYRIYGDDALLYLRLIRRARALGIKLKEVQQLLRLMRARQRPCQQVRELIASRLYEVDAAIRELQLLRGELSGLLRQMGPNHCPPSDICPIDSLVGSS